MPGSRPKAKPPHKNGRSPPTPPTSPTGTPLWWLVPLLAVVVAAVAAVQLGPSSASSSSAAGARGGGDASVVAARTRALHDALRDWNLPLARRFVDDHTRDASASASASASALDLSARLGATTPIASVIFVPTVCVRCGGYARLA